MASRTVEHADLPSFVRACAERGIRKVALRRVNEVRPVTGEGHSVTVGPAAWATLLAYQDGELLRLRVEGFGFDAARALGEAGITLRLSEANIG